MPSTLFFGQSGPDVRSAQKALNDAPPSVYPKLVVDGVFGAKTLARVKEFQAKRGLVADGIVGPKTWAALGKSHVEVPPMEGTRCGTCDEANSGNTVMLKQMYSSMKSSGSLPSGAASFASSAPIQTMTEAQRATARRAFGDSLDFSRIYITNKSGAQNRPFTVAFFDGAQNVQIMNLGTFTPGTQLLIHELAHVWQSQHHSDMFQFMRNAVASQAQALAGNMGEIVHDVNIRKHEEYPVNYPYSAYCYAPGGPFSVYAAEQMAQECELEPSGIVRTHCKTIAMNAVDPELVTAMSNAKLGDRRIAGNKC